jgi:1,4-dihydroxy-2-naphthoate octaprenyltransferase
MLGNVNLSLAIAVLVTVMAFLLGRNVVIWFLFAYALPFIAPVFLLVRHKARPKESPDFFINFLRDVGLRKWAKNLDPDDFNQPSGELPPGDDGGPRL